MKEKNTSKSSNRQVQSSIFIGNLRNEMDKLAINCKQKEMIKFAHEYIKTGMSRKETEELLKLDGFDPIMVKSFIRSDNFQEEFADDISQKWGFDIEDARGRMYSSNEDFGIVITANSEQEARNKAEEKIEKFSTLELDMVTNIYRL